MLIRHRFLCIATVGCLALGLAGCGGGAPSTGDEVRTKASDDMKKKMADSYIKGMVKSKAPHKGKAP